MLTFERPTKLPAMTPPNTSSWLCSVTGP
jgi:hypothetical protein